MANVSRVSVILAHFGIDLPLIHHFHDFFPGLILVFYSI